MNVDQSLQRAHAAVRNGCLGTHCHDPDCVSCAAVVLASEVRRLNAEITQLRKLLEVQAPPPPKPTRCKPCGNELIDGLCGVCDS